MTDTAAAAKRIWAASTSIVGTLVETYLEARGIAPMTPAPTCLRFANKLKHPKEQYFPGLVVQATDRLTGEPTGGVQRVFLAWTGKEKAQVEKKEQKLSLGPMKGGVARLAEPIEGKPLLLSEGVENAITGMQATGFPGWATLGVSGLKAFMPPDSVKHVVVLAENDGGPNQKALEVLIQALTAYGIRVDVAHPPPGLKDFNDCVNGVSGHEAGAGRALVKRAIDAAIAGEATPGTPLADDEQDGKFSMMETGLHLSKKKKLVWISQPFEILGLARDMAIDGDTTSNWGKLIRFRNRDGQVCEEIVTDGALHSDLNLLIERLANAGMHIKGTLPARRAVAEYLLSVNASDRVSVVRSTGWIQTGSDPVFVLPHAIIGNGRLSERVLLAKSLGAPYSQRGTLAEWRKAIAAPAHEHRMLRFCLSTALSGTLLSLGGFESGVFHLFGQSSEGKTTLLRVAASVWGSGADGGYIRGWRATANGLEANMAGACDTLLLLDEVGQVDSREIGQAIYMATTGVGKTRMRRDMSLRPSSQWRTTIMSTGEQPIESKLNEDSRRGRAYAGQLVRAIDIPAKQTLGVFNRPYIDFDPKAFTDEMKYAASHCYGTAGPEFVRLMIERGVDGAKVRSMVTSFVATCLENKRDYHGQAARVAERFGLVAAAGELAIEFELAPWDKGQPTKDALGLFEVWLRSRGGPVPAEVLQIIAKVRHFLEAHGDSRFEDLDRPSTNPVTGLPYDQKVTNRAGYRRGKGAKRRWLVLPQVWREEVCQGFDPVYVARILSGLGMLEPGNDGKHSRKERLPNSQGTQRFYVLTPTVFEGWEE